MRHELLQILLALALAFVCAIAPVAVVAQTPVPQQTTSSNSDAYDEYFMSDDHRQKIYEESRKKPSKAVLLTAALPGLGNIYAEQYLLAGVAFVLVAFGATFLGYGFSTKQYNIVGIGGATLLLSYGGGMITSVLGVSAHNRRLRQGLKIEQAEVREVWTPALVLRF